MVINTRIIMIFLHFQRLVPPPPPETNSKDLELARDQKCTITHLLTTFWGTKLNKNHDVFTIHITMFVARL